MSGIADDECEAAARIIRDDGNVVWVIPTKMLRNIRDFCRADVLDWSEVEFVIGEELSLRRVSGITRIEIGGPDHG